MTAFHWTKERCAERAIGYSTRTDFQRGCGAAYNSAHRRGWLDEICAHMQRPASAKSRVVYVIMSKADNRCYVGLTFKISRRIRDHKNYGRPEVKALLASPHEIIVSALGDREVAADVEARTVEMMRFMGRDVLNSAKAGGLGGFKRKWTKKRLESEARKYTSLKEWRACNAGALEAARRQGILDEITGHMVAGRKKSGTWTKAACAAEAEKHSRKVDFMRSCGSAYTIAYRNGWLDDICGHMGGP